MLNAFSKSKNTHYSYYYNYIGSINQNTPVIITAVLPSGQFKNFKCGPSPRLVCKNLFMCEYFSNRAKKIPYNISDY